jgi:hypothetical protein
MCFCNDSNQAFAWIGAILVNFGFISLITWGTTTSWTVGFLLSAVYTVFLARLANYIDHYEESTSHVYTGIPNQLPQQQDQDQKMPRSLTSMEITDATEATETRSPQRRVSIVVNLLYGLAILSVGVTGLFLPINLAPDCNSSSSSTWNPQYRWKTDSKKLPNRAIINWAAKSNGEYDNGNNEGATVGYVESTGITLFKGVNYSSPQSHEYLWTVCDNRSSIEHTEYLSPDPFLTVTSNRVCFQTTDDVKRKQLGPKIYCSDGRTFQEANIVDPMNRQKFQLPPYGNFKVDNRLLWFVQSVSTTGDGGGMGILVYSLEPESMNVTLYSERVKNNDDNNNNGKRGGPDDCIEPVRLRPALVLLASALPMFLLSLSLWKKKQIPSMGLTTYLSLSFCYVALHVLISPDSDEYNNENLPFRWWYATTGLIWLLLSSYFIILSDNQMTFMSRDPWRWALIISSLAFVWGTSALIMSGDETVGRWILWNLTVFFPLIFFGVVTDAMFLLVLGGLGLLVDVARVASLIDNSPIWVALVFCVSGLGIGAVGYKLSHFQPPAQAWATAHVDRIHAQLLQCTERHDPSEIVDESNLL